MKTLLAPEAFHGWLGQWVRNLEPLTEADPVALLCLGLGALGHCVRETVRVQGGHPVNQLMVLVGDERAGGGIAWGHVDRLFSAVSADWKKELRPNLLPPRRDWGVWANWWKRGTGSFLGWSRTEEVLDQLTHPEANYSGFAPRTLLLRIRGGTPRPLGDVEDVNLDAALDLKTSLEFCERELIPSRLGVSQMAELLWEAMYLVLREPRIGGAMIDIMTQLAERHVIRLAGLYAIVDRNSEIKPDHLLAALAVWDHTEATLYDLFAGQTGDKKTDLVLSYLREHSRATTHEINRDVLGGNSAAGPILKHLEEAGMVYSQKERGRGQSRLWFPAQDALKDSQARSYLGVAKEILATLAPESTPPVLHPIRDRQCQNVR